MLKNLSTFVDIFSLVYISTLERRKSDFPNGFNYFTRLLPSFSPFLHCENLSFSIENAFLSEHRRSSVTCKLLLFVPKNSKKGKAIRSHRHMRNRVSPKNSLFRYIFANSSRKFCSLGKTHRKTNTENRISLLCGSSSSGQEFENCEKLFSQRLRRFVKSRLSSFVLVARAPLVLPTRALLVVCLREPRSSFKLLI